MAGLLERQGTQKTNPDCKSGAALLKALATTRSPRQHSWEFRKVSQGLCGTHSAPYNIHVATSFCTKNQFIAPELR